MPSTDWSAYGMAYRIVEGLAERMAEGLAGGRSSPRSVGNIRDAQDHDRRWFSGETWVFVGFLRRFSDIAAVAGGTRHALAARELWLRITDRESRQVGRRFCQQMVVSRVDVLLSRTHDVAAGRSSSARRTTRF